MALSTYTELKATLADYLHRTDMTSRIVDFITLAESEINSEIRTRLMETDASLTLVSGTNTIALPTRYSEPILLELVISGRENTPLRYLTPSQMEDETETGSTYEPRYWTINGSNIEFPNDADQDYSVRFRHLADFDLATTSTNTLLTKYPGIYLYGSLLQAEPFMNNDPRIATWANFYANLKKVINRKEARTRSLATLGTDVAIRGSRINNIFKG
jgi:hypothetical protein